ncbi:MAG: cytochrome c [Acidimicrobiia bacterium]|nr:cytochrome c [Actinomycetota bacterium]MBL6924194.1 cytochrome c [Acidimicrobiia bacterium]
MRITRLIAGAVLVALMAGCGGTTPSSTAPAPTAAAASSGGGDVSAGADVYKSTCSSCHAPDASGLKGLGKELVGTTFMSQASDDLVAFLKVGRGPSDADNTTGVQMPPRGGNPSLGDDDLLNVVAYLKSLG